MPEVWVKFKEGYEVSDKGQVRSLDRAIIRSDTKTPVRIYGKLMKPRLHRCGYLVIELSFNNEKERYFVHRLVAMCFIPNPDNKPQVNHKDGNKSNNIVSNLEWVTNSENQKHAVATGLKPIYLAEKAPRFSGEVHAFDKEGNLVAVLKGNVDMKSKGFDFRLVSACLHGKRKSHRGCTFVKIPSSA
jgi:hypothetical protein